jgi:hypothetical protein
MQPKYKRVLLKLSGEALLGNEATPDLANWDGQADVIVQTIENYCGGGVCADATVTVNGDAFDTVVSGGTLDVPVEYVNGDVVPTTIVSGVLQVPNPIPFTPHQLNPTIWLEATTNRYILTSSRISTYAANYGSNPTQTTGAARPIPVADGLNDVVDFDDAARYLNLNSTLSDVVNSTNNTGGFEIWTIIKLDSGRSGTPVYFGARTATKLYFQLFHGGSGKLRWFLGDTVGTDARALTNNSVFPIGQTEWVLCRLVHNEAEQQMKIFVNGLEMSLDATQNGDTSALDFNNYNPAYNVYLNGVNNTNVLASATSGMLFGDFIAFNRLLTESEATNLTNYFI